jgi:hypothetical protein
MTVDEVFRLTPKQAQIFIRSYMVEHLKRIHAIMKVAGGALGMEVGDLELDEHSVDDVATTEDLDAISRRHIKQLQHRAEQRWAQQTKP